jgi:hypothetical protein
VSFFIKIVSNVLFYKNKGSWLNKLLFSLTLLVGITAVNAQATRCKETSKRSCIE